MKDECEKVFFLLRARLRRTGSFLLPPPPAYCFCVASGVASWPMLRPRPRLAARIHHEGQAEVEGEEKLCLDSQLNISKDQARHPKSILRTENLGVSCEVRMSQEIK
jgi:hypothetical protein